MELIKDTYGQLHVKMGNVIEIELNMHNDCDDANRFSVALTTVTRYNLFPTYNDACRYFTSECDAINHYNMLRETFVKQGLVTFLMTCSQHLDA